MKVLLLSSEDLVGGAARAADRLHQGLHSINVSAQMLVQTKLGDDFNVIAPTRKLDKAIAKLRPSIDAIPSLLYPNRDRSLFSSEWRSNSVPNQINQIAPDIINLHWICHGFLSIESIARLNRPLVWTLHDMWAFTGGCHYSFDCDRYIQSCGACPHLGSDRDWDLSRWNWQRKAKNWSRLNLVFVTPSQWLAKSARASSLCQNVCQNSRIEVIPYGIDLQIYKPIDRQLARQILNLPLDKRLVLFGAIHPTSEQRKGFHLLQPALQALDLAWQDQLEIVIFGASQPQDAVNLNFKTHYLGRLNDDISLALIYAAVDVFVAPSIQDNLPNTVMESIACGTPCVAFNIGGMPDLIDHKQNGYLAHPFDPNDLAYGINWVLEDVDRHQQLVRNARSKAEQEFSLERQAHRYLQLFEEIVELT